MKEVLLKIIKEKAFISLLNKYQNKSSINIKDRLTIWNSNLESPEFIIPVLGTQGSGKSSLLNALLLDDIVLPVDADETTCIPTEIRYGDNRSPLAKVVFNNGKEKDIPCTSESLKPYVHQESNPGNRLGVEKIIIYYKHSILKSGIILVDLPGSGSLTSENVKTTSEYIKKSSGAIFLLRTIPPLTQSESVFIQGCWPLMTNSFFIQNQWVDERMEEVEDGKSFSYSVLQKVAQKCGLPKDDIEIDIIGVDQALKAKIKNDITALKKSGLLQFLSKLELFSQNWHNKIALNIKSFILEALTDSKYQIIDRLKMLEKNIDEHKKEILQREKEFKKELENNQNLVDECLDDIEKSGAELQRSIKDICKTSAENLRNQIREIISGGVVGGEYLGNAFRDCQQEQEEYIFQEIQPIVIKFSQQTLSKIGNIREFSFQRRSFESNQTFSEKNNWHSFYSSAGSFGGAIGGFALAGIGLKSGATIGATLGSFVPGIGNLAGAVGGAIIGFIGGILGSFMGNKAQEYHIDKQKETARGELFKFVEMFRKTTEEAYIEELNNYVDGIKDAMHSWIQESEIRFKENIENLSNFNKQTETEKKESISSLSNDLEIVNHYCSILNSGDKNGKGK